MGSWWFELDYRMMEGDRQRRAICGNIDYFVYYDT